MNLKNFKKMLGFVGIKIVFLIVSCLALVVSSYATDRQVQLSGVLKDDIRIKASGSMSSFINTTVNSATKILDLEFLDSADNLTVEVWDSNGVCIYNYTTDVIYGVHLIADLSVSKAKSFDVYIYNDATGTFITGTFLP